MGKSVIQYYNAYDEEARLFRDYGHQIEWRTTMHYFRKVIQPGSRIFDGCAGTGRYAFQLAAEGHSVAASDLVPSYVEKMLLKQEKNPILKDIFVGDICEPNHYGDGYFDVVLCMGALYHLEETMRDRAMEQCLRLLKKEGILVLTYINLMGALPLYLASGLENVEEIAEGYERRCFEEPFVYLLPEEMEELAQRHGLKILHHLTSDGNPYLRGEAFAGAKEEDFEKYMELHLKICENRNAVGGGLHGLVFLARK